MTDRDVPAAVRLHRRELPHGLFPRLGASFLRAYYRTFVHSPHAVALVALGEGPATGHLVGTTDHGSHHRWVIRRHGWRLAARGAIGLVVHPGALRLFIGSRLRRYARVLLRVARRPDGQGPVGAAAPASGGAPVAVLVHVAVSPAVRGRGVGRHLTDAFVHEALAHDVRDVRLVTRADGGAGAFYRALGWQRVENRQRDGRDVEEYRLSAT